MDVRRACLLKFPQASEAVRRACLPKFLQALEAVCLLTSSMKGGAITQVSKIKTHYLSLTFKRVELETCFLSLLIFVYLFCANSSVISSTAYCIQI